MPKAARCVLLAASWAALSHCSEFARSDASRRFDAVTTPEEGAPDAQSDAVATDGGLDADALAADTGDASTDPVSVDEPADAADAASADGGDAGPVADCGTSGLRSCGGRCVDIASDNANCGACGAACVAGAHATAACNAGDCELTCLRGFSDCDGMRSTGCETDLSSPMSCGTCVRACAAGQACAEQRCVEFADLPPPRLFAPVSGVRVPRRRPELTFVPVPGAGGAQVQICRQRSCNADQVVAEVDSTGNRATAPMDLAPGVYFWRARSGAPGGYGTRYSPTWQFRVPTRDNPVTTATWGAEPDFNGDGYADIAVGAPLRNMSAGAVYVFYGSASGPAATPSWQHLGGDGPNSRHGFATASVGDVNGDGFVDLGVGSSETAIAAGRGYVFFGGPSGLADTPGFTLPGATEARAGEFMSALGDIDGDGYADLAMSGPTAGGMAQGAVYVFTGRASGAITSPSLTLRNAPPMAQHRLGRGMSCVGDMNGDGFADLVAGASGSETAVSAAYLFSGAPGGIGMAPARVFRGAGVAGEFYGFAVSGVGDVNGDGFNDVLIGASGMPSNTFGQVRLFYGSAGSLSPIPAWELRGAAGEFLGESVSGGADVNGDGYDDILVVAPGVGIVRLWYGSSMGPMSEPVVLLTEEGDMNTGATRGAVIGDVDGDGFADVVVGSVFLNGERGRVRLYRGARGGINPRPSWFAESADAGSRFGLQLGRW